MINKKKNLLVKSLFMGVFLLSVFLPAFANSASRGLPYLHIENALTSDAFQFNEKGVNIAPTDPPQALSRGWIVLTGFDPIVIKNRNVTIFVQQESVLSVSSDDANDLQFYLVAGSASFLRDETFLGKMSVNTPISAYKVMGPGEIFVSSDVSELVFSLGSTVEVTNTISRKRTTLSPYHYLDLADPFLKEKQISKQTYNTLSINPKVNRSSLLPSATVTDGITITTRATLMASEKKQEPIVAPKPVVAPVVVEPVVTPKPKVVEPVVTPKPKVVEPVVIPKPKVIMPVIIPKIEVDEPKAKVVEPVVAPKAEVVEPTAKVVEPVVAPKAEVVEPTDKVVEPVVAPKPVVAPVVVKPVVATEPVVVVEDEIFNVYIIHTNDAMGAINDSAIPYPRLATLLKWNKNVHPRTLLLDAGNSLSGSEIANMNKGLDAATLYQTLGYDAISPSTAEYAFGVERLIEGVKLAKKNNYLDILSTNVTDESGDLLFTPYSIYDLDGYSVGVIGLSFPQGGVDGLSFYPNDAVRKGQLLVDEVAAKSDYVVVLGNITPFSPYTVEQIASTINGIDLIIDGKYGSGKQEIGSTLIVQAGEKLTSVGVVELKIVNNELGTVSSFEITKDDVASPETSALAQSFNITSIPQDEKVASFINSLNQELLAKKEAEKVPPAIEAVVVSKVTQDVVVEEEPIVEEVAVAEEVAVTEEEVSPLAIQPQQGITTSVAPEEEANTFGVKTSFVGTKNDVLGTANVQVGFSVNPYLEMNKTRLGLQVFYLTDGSLFDPFNATNGNLDIESGILGLLRSSMRFIDYFYYGEEGDALYIQMDDVTPITFNRGFIVNNYIPTSGPANENMGLYASFQTGMFGIQAFVDDMYLTSLYSGNTQNAALRFSFDIGSAFEIGVGTVVNSNRSINDVTLYPTLDASWLVRNTRTFQLSLYGGATTSVDMIPFSITPLYNSSGSGFSAKFPNFQVTGGIEMTTPKWNISLIASAMNATDPLVAYGSINETYYSGERIAQYTGIQFLAGVKTQYTADRFGLDLSYYLPIEQNFSKIIPLDAFPTRTGDTLIVGVGYTGKTVSAKAGIRKFGVVSSLKELFAFDDGLNGFFSDAYDFIGEAGVSAPYLSGTYTSGPFSIYADFSFLKDGKSNLTVGSTIDIGTQSTEIVERKEKKDDELTYSLDLGTSYTRLLASGSDKNYFSVTPLLTVAKGNVSFGFGPHITFDADAGEIYHHFPTSPLSFSNNVTGLFAKTFDIASDLAASIDHLQIGTPLGGNFLSINKTQSYSMGPLINVMNTSTDSALQNKLSMIAKIDTQTVDIDLFVNDLTSIQLSSMRVGITPFKTWGGELGLSGIISAKLAPGDKQLDVITTIDGIIPLSKKEHSSLDIFGGFSTLLGYDRADGFKQMLYNSSASSFLGRFNNYMISGGVNATMNKVTINAMASTQEGAISYGMYNSFFTREREDIVAGFDDQWTNSSTSSGRTYSVSIDTTFEGKSYDLFASYLLPLTSSFSPIETEDLLHLGLDVDVKNFTIGLEYTRRGFLGATKDFLNSNAAITSRAKTFILDNNSLVGVSLGVESGNLALNAKVGTYTSFTSDNSYNGVTTGTTTPFLSLSANINMF